jgi:transcriptional regulator with XRE-family HTH domain
MSQKKRYREVSEMVRADSSPDFADAFEKRLAERQLIKKLIVLRTRCGLSQEELATRLNCTQSKISKLENGKDSDIRIGDLLAYAAAAGYHMEFIFAEDDVTIADEVKYHFFQTTSLMEKMVHLANVDEAIAKGIAGFFGEACCNFMKMLIDKVKALPKQARDHVPVVRLVSEIGECEPGKDDTSNAGGRKHCENHNPQKNGAAMTA